MNVAARICATTAAVVWAFNAFAAQHDIYPSASQADGDVRAALSQAASSHKRVILDFGGNWCTDCHVLDYYLHDSNNLPLLEANYVLVHVNIGHLDENLKIASRFDVPLNKGVPALAVIGEDGKLLFSQTNGEFESMRHMQSASVTEFLQHWKNPAP